MAKEKEPDRLSQQATMALAAGMSYGKWMALHSGEFKKPAKKEYPKRATVRVCFFCGKEFLRYDKRMQRYCSEECRASAEREREQKKRIAENATD